MSTAAGIPGRRVQRKLTLDRIYSAPSLSGIDILQISWSPDGRLLTYISVDEDKQQMWAYDVASRSKRLLYECAKKIEPPRVENQTRLSYTFTESRLLSDPNKERYSWRIRRQELSQVQILNVEWSPNGRQMLLGSTFYGPYSLFDILSGQLSAPLPIPPQAEDIHFSYDGRWLSYMLLFNLYALDLATGQTIVLTRTGTETIRFATGRTYGDFLTQGYWWSRDSRRIAVLASDVRNVPQMPVQDLTSLRHRFLNMDRFSHPGDDVPLSRLCVVSSGGNATWIDPGPWGDYYLARVRWLPDSTRLAVQFLNRNQNHLVLAIADATTGHCYPVLEESDPAWINLSEDLRFLAGGNYFLWSSERNSYRHLYIYGLDGRELLQLTSGDCACVQLKAIDESNGVVYFQAYPPPHVDCHLMKVSYEVGPHGMRAGRTERVTRLPGSHPVEMSPDNMHFADLYQTIQQPPRLDVYRSDGVFIETVQDNRVDELSQYLAPLEFFQIPAAKLGDPSDELQLCAGIIRPPNINRARRYPAIIYVYGGPGEGGSTRVVVNKWRHVPTLWLQMMAQNGYVIFAVDNRGSCEAPRGHAFEALVCDRLGEVELADQLEGARYLRSLPFVDPGRIGIIGGSFGGYMVLNAMLRAPKIFKAGVAFAPVTNWQGYDNIYAEHYMKLPGDNQAGYANTQLPPLAENLQNKLLLLHGSADINVHLHHTLNLVNDLLAAGREYDLMLFPGQGHTSFFDVDEQAQQIFARITDFFQKNL